MDIELLKETVGRVTDRNQEEFKNLAESHGVGFAASAMTSALADTMGLVLSMAKTEEMRAATLIGFMSLIDKATDRYRSSIQMLRAIDKAKGVSHED